jgi:hypothetical protein
LPEPRERIVDIEEAGEAILGEVERFGQLLGIGTLAPLG